MDPFGPQIKNTKPPLHTTLHAPLDPFGPLRTLQHTLKILKSLEAPLTNGFYTLKKVLQPRERAEEPVGTLVEQNTISFYDLIPSISDIISFPILIVNLCCTV